MLCKKCGTNLPPRAKHCPECGAEVSFEKKFSDMADDFFNSAEDELTSAVEEVKDSFNGEKAGGKLKDDRGLLSYILLTIITFGIYSYYFLYKIAKDVNVACEEDGEKTAGLVAFILLSFVTCGIYTWVWYYKLGNRLAENAPRYGMHFQENGTTVLLWLLFGAFICGIGPFIAMYIIIKNTNKICYAYNKAHGFRK